MTRLSRTEAQDDEERSGDDQGESDDEDEEPIRTRKGRDRRNTNDIKRRSAKGDTPKNSKCDHDKRYRRDCQSFFRRRSDESRTMDRRIRGHE